MSSRPSGPSRVFSRSLSTARKKCTHRAQKTFATELAITGREQAQYRTGLLDDLVGDSEQRLWHAQPQCLSGFKIDYQFKFGRLLDRQVSRLNPLQYPVHVNRCASIESGVTDSVCD